MVTRRLPPALALLAGLAACSDPPSLLLTVEHDPGLAVRQLRITPTPGDANPLRSQTTPASPGEPLASTETVRLSFDRALAGELVRIDVEGLDSRVVAVRSESVVLEAGETALTIVLSTCGCHPHEECTFDGCRCGATGKDCASGQVCQDDLCRCTSASCPEGCCAESDGLCHAIGSTFCGLPGGQCSDCLGAFCVAGKCETCDCPDGCCQGSTCVATPSAAACGPKGGTCRDCTGGSGDACSSAGECSCGAGPICPSGKRCDRGSCVCDALSCPLGCCQGGECHTPTSAASCGTAGGTCADCGAGADSCGDDGRCRCGAGSACQEDLRCEGGQCVCNATSCPTGCCAGSACVKQPNLAACGLPATACQVCDPLLADRCTDGACKCGSGTACQKGQRCTPSGCVCDATSCPGCCSGDVCELGNTTSKCGTNGAACAPCDDLADRCTAGVCSCGSGTKCQVGTSCSGGTCACNSTSCPLGCCTSTGCANLSISQCGIGGEACVACDARSDACLASGDCGCSSNGGPPCGDGLHCTVAGCACDAASCPGGCCSATGCEPPRLAACGMPGAACQACDALRADGCTSGSCTCLGGPACAAGQRCTAAGCTCDSTSCADGCCFGKTCTPLGVHACSAPGTTCQDCGEVADGCAATGACTCGGGPACGSGQVCSGGACVCNATSCPTGCCSGTTCVPDGTALSACGANGAQCQVCDTTLASVCSNGACRCGVFAACSIGSACVSGVCQCNASTCTSGCCSGKVCTARTGAACGPLGGACIDCGRTADGCSASGACQCGSGPPCGAGLRCSGGACVCDATSGCAGCCSGNACVAGTDLTACGSGSAACQVCAPLADQCAGQRCKCGIAAPCPAGKTCLSGVCTP
ncbi:MAG TPA: hypothetical protein VGK67_25850 [Myxococcales bacterium]